MSEEVDDIPDGPLLTEAEAAKDLKVSRSFLAKASMNGTGPEFINAVQPFATRRARSRSTKQRRRVPPRRNTPSASATALVSRSRPAGLGVVGKSRDRSHRGPPRYRPTSSKDIAPVSVAWVGSARGSPNPLRGNPGTECTRGARNDYPRHNAVRCDFGKTSAPAFGTDLACASMGRQHCCWTPNRLPRLAQET
jgi:hypothetical protein